MGLLGSIWVKLGLKNDEFKRGIQQSESKLSSFRDGVKKISAVAVAAWAAVGAGLIKLGKEFVNQTQLIGDKWGIFTAELSAGWGMFVAGISSGQGWNELISNISRAVDAAREAQMALDELFERQNSYSIEAAKVRNEIAQLTTDMRDPSKSADERIAAAKRVIELEKQLGVVREDIANQEYEAHKKNFQARTGLNDAQTEFLVDEYNKNRDIIQQAEEYNKKVREAKELEKSFRSQSGDAIKWEDVLKAREAASQFAKEIGQNGVEVAKLVNQYNIGNDALVANMVKAKIATISVSGEVTAASRRANTMLGTLKNSLNTAAEAAQTEASAHKGIINQLNGEIAAKTKLRDQATDRTELMRLNEEIVALQKKLELLKQYTSTQATQLPSAEAPSQTGEAYSIAGTGADKAIAELEALSEAYNRNQKAANDWANNIIEIGPGVSQMLTNTIAGAFEYLGEAIVSGDFDTGSMVKVLLTPLADMAIQIGGVIMSAGLAIEALKVSLITFGGIGAIIAGGALIAIGSMAKGALSSIGSSASTTGASTNGNYTGGYGTNYINGNGNGIVEFRVKGQDLVAVMNTYNQQKYRG